MRFKNDRSFLCFSDSDSSPITAEQSTLMRESDDHELFFSGDTRLEDKLARKPYARRGTVRQRARHTHRAEAKVFFPRNATETEPVPLSVGRHQRWRFVAELLDENLHAVRCDADPRRGSRRSAALAAADDEANQTGARRNLFLVQGRKVNNVLSFRRVSGKKVAASAAGAARVLIWTPEIQEMADRNRLTKKDDARMLLLARC